MRSLPGRCRDSDCLDWSPGLRIIFSILWWGLLSCCRARDTVICTTGEQIGYAAHSSLFDFEEHKLQMVWFDTASLIPLPDSGKTSVSLMEYA